MYAGDLNLIQDQYADLSNFSQTVDVGNIRIGDSSIQVLKYGAAEARISAALRIDGILRGLGGLYAGAFTTTQRDAIAAGYRPAALIIFNTTNNRFEWNAGSDAVPNWQPISSAELAWTPFTPTLVASGGGLSFGTGGAQGAWIKIGRTVHWRANFSWVGGSVGSGFYTVVVPTGTPVIDTLLGTAETIAGHGFITNAGTSRDDPIAVIVRDADEFLLRKLGAVGANLGSADNPGSINLAGTYETTT